MREGVFHPGGMIALLRREAELQGSALNRGKGKGTIDVESEVGKGTTFTEDTGWLVIS